MWNEIFTFNNIAGFCSILGLIVTFINLWYVGTIKKNQKEYEKMVLFNNVMEGHLSVLKNINRILKEAVKDYDKQVIKESLSNASTFLEIIEDIIPDKYAQHRNTCKKLILNVENHKKGDFAEDKKNDLSDIEDTCHNIKSLIDKLSIVLETKVYLY